MVRFDRLRKSGVAKIDRHIRICLTMGGPVYCLKEVVSGDGYRRRGFISNTVDFAELLMSFANRQDVKGFPW